MCIIFLSLNSNPQYKFILLANRDENYHRPSSAATFWSPDILAGRDLISNGSWLGITKQGRFAAITNVISSNISPGIQSRGSLVIDFLKSAISPLDYVTSLRGKDNYPWYNIIVGDTEQIFIYSNESDQIISLNKSGIYGIGNVGLNKTSPKLERGKILLADCTNIEQLFDILNDRTKCDDKLLPRVLDVEVERAMSTIFVKSSEFGTRAQTVILIDYNDKVTFIERSLDDDKWIEKSFNFYFTI